MLPCSLLRWQCHHSNDMLLSSDLGNRSLSDISDQNMHHHAGDEFQNGSAYKGVVEIVPSGTGIDDLPGRKWA